MLDLTHAETTKISDIFRDLPANKKLAPSETPGLNERQRAAIELLAMGKSFKAAAKALGVDARTIFNWRKDELFQSELDRRHQELWGNVTDRLRLLVDPSLEVMAEHLNDAFDRNRYLAAATILRLAKVGARDRSRDEST
jgi:transposase-like protein